MKAWYERAFGEFYLQLYSHRDAGEARRVLDLLFSDDELQASVVLDLACGAGRYLPEIERKGAQALGFDLSMPLLLEAVKRYPETRLARADMRHIPLADASVDWVLSLFTSFGYFEDMEAHCRLAREWSRVARRGLVVDVPNPAYLRAKLVPVSQRRRDSFRIEETRRLESDPLRVVKEVRVSSEHGEPVLDYEERVMLFDPEELDEILEQAGMSPVDRYGDYDGSEFDRELSPRQLLLCRSEGAAR